jgi:hypothetical protein
MVPAEVLAELQPFVALAQGLGTAAVQLVGSHGFTDVHITYASPRGGARRSLPSLPCFLLVSALSAWSTLLGSHCAA